MYTSIVHYKLFVGCKLTADLKRELEKNQGWKKAPKELKEVYHLQQEYLGIYLPETDTSLAEFQAYEKEITSILFPCCTESLRARLKIYLFPQLFIS